MKNCCQMAAMFQQVCLACNKPKKGLAMKNLCGKTRPKDNPYEVWVHGDWTWNVLKKWQGDDKKPYARWFCNVVTPIVPEGEMGDVYVKDIISIANRIK